MQLSHPIQTVRPINCFPYLAILFFLFCGKPDCHGQNLRLQKQFGDLTTGSSLTGGDKVTFTANFKLKTDTRLGVLNLQAKIAPQQHVYSVTQKKGGPLRSTIRVSESDQFQVIGNFTPDSPPHIDENSDIYDVPIEHHVDSVVWSAPIRLADGIDPKKVKIELIFNGQVCESNETGEVTGCQPLENLKVVAKFTGFDPQLAVANSQLSKITVEEVKPFKPKFSHVNFAGQIVRADGIKANVSPGDKIVLQLTAEPLDGFHIYAYEHQKSGEIYSTLVAFSNDNGWEPMKPDASEPPEENKELGYKGHHHPVTWSFNINVPDDVELKNYTLNGLIGFQTCTDHGCDPYEGASFSVVIPVGSGSVPFPVKFEGGTSYEDVVALIGSTINSGSAESGYPNATGVGRAADSPAEIAEMATYYDATKKIKYLKLTELDDHPIGSNSGNVERKHTTTLWSAMGLIFLGGIILNAMPCVFPVLGLKVMGFVEQAGSDPKKIRLHGIAFAMGLVFSMWVLAGIVLTLKFAFGRNVSWGSEQMGNPYFVGPIIILLFLLGLNMAGVFEIGTSMTRVGGGQPKKGYSASFLSGILTTLIATPCSGPFLGSAMGYTLSQPALISMWLFTVFALGIAFPYLALSFFPAAINKLPRPGAWMHTFKVTMAFLLFAAVAFFMQSFGGQTGVDGLSWLIMAMVVIGLAAFFYGTWSPAYVKPQKRFWFGWVMPGLIAAVGCWMTYDAMNYRNNALASHHAGGLDWQEWNPGKIEYMLDKKPRIVWVDYTADW